ncbi:MAG: GntR family transcriptional regulator [Corynebacterium sp.]|uniref:GntR family transcriptional regulator n=1 Tax=unclassified Corynebacterium TaxID=2624378 RepID=UPI0009603F39|nr:GntR family transcriptional regulator [Corynebacterium sp. CNJ-954]OLT53694.1 hypothetical protein BJF89_02435 [Corynebacterium sp. CNJ-954]
MPSTPRWRQISEDVLQKLQDGAFSDTFPGELELSERYRVSRGTIRRALQPLRDQGIVGGGRGRQSYVIDAGRSPGLGPVRSLHDAISAVGDETPPAIPVQRIETNLAVSTALGLPSTTEYVHAVRIRYTNGLPFSADRFWFDVAVARPLLDTDLSSGSVYEILHTVAGVELSGTVEYTTAAPAWPEIADQLQIDVGTPLLTVRRKSCHHNRPVELRDTCTVGERATLTQVTGDVAAVLNCDGRGKPVDIPWT